MSWRNPPAELLVEVVGLSHGFAAPAWANEFCPSYFNNTGVMRNKQPVYTFLSPVSVKPRTSGRGCKRIIFMCSP